MPIDWSVFDAMVSSVFEDQSRLLALAEEGDPADKDEYQVLCQRVLDTAGKIRESTGTYTPNVTVPSDRARWMKAKGDVESVRSWVLTNKGVLWPK